MSRSQKNWGWFSGAVALALAVVSLIAWAVRVEAKALTKDEAKKEYATKESVDLLRGDVQEVKVDVKTLLQRTAPHYREVRP